MRRFSAILRAWMSEPAGRGGLPLDLSDLKSRRKVITRKPSLRTVYHRWYASIINALHSTDTDGAVVEIGSGAGLFKEALPEAITSDIVPGPGLDALLDSTSLPFSDGSLRAIVMVNVFHHIAHPGAFLTEAGRCLRRGGMVAMVEPWVTPWSRLAYSLLHHEPFEPCLREPLLADGRTAVAENNALAWLLFGSKTRQMFAGCSDLELTRVRPFMPFAFLCSGGLSYRSLVPGCAFPLVTAAEALLTPANRLLGMFALIALRRRV